MSYDVPMGNNAAGHISNLPFKEQVRLQFSDMGKRAWSSAKNFGYIGMIYAGVECGVESLRAKNDIYNGVAAGCITGGGLAYKSGPQAAAIGCAGFAAFSTAIDLYMKMDSGKPPSDDYDEWINVYTFLDKILHIFLLYTVHVIGSNTSNSILEYSSR